MSSSEARRIHIEAWQAGGISQAAYCREHGLNAKTFGNWVRRHRASECSQSSALVPVTIRPVSAPVEMLHLRGRGDHVLELPSTVSPHWLGELLKCL
ncbi:MAG TPA: hypothetical protein PLG04_09440 [Anaerolineaceae bacterium]|jgi:transposase-like protein|nr:IS66 family insertion sequence element accessory protein TnpB [Nitrosomonas europaea]HOR78998.1 hypothetical protein [Anaerolineaceae bacterium]